MDGPLYMCVGETSGFVPLLVVSSVGVAACGVWHAIELITTDASKLWVADMRVTSCVPAYVVKWKTGKSKGTSPNNQCLCSPF